MNKRSWLFFILIFIVFSTYIFFVRNWFFDAEDYITIYFVSLVKNFKDYINFFSYEGNFFRPLILFYNFIIYNFFGINAYSYFLCIIFVHALNTGLLFYGLSFFIKYYLAFLGALFFAFHPTLYSFLGKIDLVQHNLALFFALLALILLKKSLDKDNKKIYIFSCFLFLLSILTRETFIFLPVIIFLAIRFFPEISNKKLIKFLDQIKLIFGFVCVLFIYFLVKKLTYLLSDNISFPDISRILSFNFLYNLIWVQLYPLTAYKFFQNYGLSFIFKLIKFFILFLMFLLFVTNKQKKLVLFFLFSTLLLYWPLVFLKYFGFRFFYEGNIFYVAFLVSLINFSKLNKYFIYKNLVSFFLIILIIINTAFTIYGMNDIANFREKTYLAVQKLKNYNNSFFKKNTLLIFNSNFNNNKSQLINVGLIESLKLNGITGENFQYFYSKFNINYSVLEFFKYFKIVQNKNFINFISLDENKVWFSLDGSDMYSSFVQKVIVNRIGKLDHILDLTIILKEECYKKDLITFIIWNDLKNEFEVYK